MALAGDTSALRLCLIGNGGSLELFAIVTVKLCSFD